MKDEKEDGGNEDSLDSGSFEYDLQKARIRKILEETIFKLKLMTRLSQVLQNDGEILRKFLIKAEADFVVQICKENTSFIRVEERPDLEIICNMLERINCYDTRRPTSALTKKSKVYPNADHFDTHVAFAVDVIFKCKPLIEYMTSLEDDPESVMTAFIDSMLQLEKIVNERLNVSAIEELKRENDLKTAYKFSMMLTSNISELEELLEKQREELTREHDRKEEIMLDLSEKVDTLKSKCKNDINRIVVDSEVNMMKDYNKSAELQVDLSKDASDSTRQYEMLLEDHLHKEKILRAKRLKVETQLANWIAKYDTDIGEKQAEYDKLEETYAKEKEEMDLLQEKFDEQEEEYFVLMKEKEEEEEQIMFEKMWIFLQNRSARVIQRMWRAYKARKMARKKGKKSKKKEKGGSAGSKKEKKSPKEAKKGGSAGSKKGKKSPKEDVKKEESVMFRDGQDPNKVLSKQFSIAVLEDIKSKEAFSKHDFEVDLMKDDE